VTGKKYLYQQELLRSIENDIVGSGRFMKKTPPLNMIEFLRRKMVVAKMAVLQS